MEEKLIEELRRVPYGTLLKIMWLDASTVRGATIKLPLPNYYIETKRTTVGSYVSLQRSQSQKVHHLILEMDNTEGSGSMIRSIPLCLIYKIVMPPSKEPEAWERFVNRNKRVRNVGAKAAIRLKDGSVKLFDK